LHREEKLEEIVNLLSKSLRSTEPSPEHATSGRESEKKPREQSLKSIDKEQIQRAKEIQAQTIPKEAPVEDERIYKEFGINPSFIDPEDVNNLHNFALIREKNLKVEQNIQLWYLERKIQPIENTLQTHGMTL